MDDVMRQQRAAALRLGGGMVLLGTVVWIGLSGLRGALPGAASDVLYAGSGRALATPPPLYYRRHRHRGGRVGRALRYAAGSIRHNRRTCQRHTTSPSPPLP